MGLQSPMESRKSEDARLQPASDDENATNLGREIYDRHISMSSVAGARSAAWQALRLETFGANRLPLLARLAQRWARVAILPQPKASTHEWYVARAASSRTARSSPTSLTVHAASPATSTFVPIRAAEGPALSTLVAADSPKPVHTASVVTANADQKVEWGPPIFQAGNALRTNRGQINRTRGNREEGAPQTSSGSTIAENKRSPIQGDVPILRRETQRPEQLQGAESLAHSDISGQLPPVRPAEPLESMAASLAAIEPERRSIATMRSESTVSNSTNAESAATAVPEQTADVRVSESPISVDSKPVHLQDKRRISVVSLNEVPVTAVPIQHTTRIARKTAPSIVNRSNKDKDADEPSRTPSLPRSREAVDSQPKFPTEDARPSDTPMNIEVHNAGQDSVRPDAVPAALETALSRPPEGVETSVPSALPLVTSESHGITTAEQSHLQRHVNHVPAQKADASRDRSESAVGSLPIAVAEAVSQTISNNSVPFSVAPGSPKSPDAPWPVALSDSAFVSKIESPAQGKVPAIQMRSTPQVLRVADVPAARENRAVTKGQRMDLPNSEIALDFRESASNIVDEPTTISKQAKPDGESTYLDRVATEQAQASFVALMNQPLLQGALPHSESAGAIFRTSDPSGNRKSPELAAERDVLEPTGDFSRPVALDGSVSQTEKTTFAVLHTGAATSHREPRALATRIAGLAPFVQRTPVQEIHRAVAAPNVAAVLSRHASAVSNAVAQPRSGSRFAPVIQTHQMSTFSAAAETAHLQRAVAAATPPDAIEASVPLPFASSGPANPSSSSSFDVGQVADRVYHMLVDRLASEKARRGM
jgi:hypothetical protein